MWRGLHPDEVEDHPGSHWFWPLQGSCHINTDEYFMRQVEEHRSCDQNTKRDTSEGVAGLRQCRR